MQLKLSKNNLAVAISRVQGAISERNLAYIGLKAENNRLHITSADRVLAIYCHLDCIIIDHIGTAFVPAKFFSDVVRELPSGEVEIKTVDSWLIVSAGENRAFTMKIPIAEELAWREAPKLAWSSEAALPAIKLSYMIEQVQFCVAQESSRNYGTVGFLHKVDSDSLRMVGTDGFRLSYCDIACSMPDSFLTKGVCISKRALGELSRMCHEGFEMIHLSISQDETTMCAQVEDYEIYVLLSSVKYPNYQGVLPIEQPSDVRVSRPTLQSVAKRVLLAAGKTKALQLSFSPSSLTLSSRNVGSAEGRENISLQDYSGPVCELAVNGKFLSDVFATTTSDELHIQFKDNEDPIVLVPSLEPKDCISKHVLVPIRESD